MDGHVNEPLNHTPEIQVLKRNRTLPEEFAWPSKSKTQKKSLYAFYDAGARPWLIIQIWELPTSYPKCHLKHIFMFNMQGSYICTMRSGKTCSWELVQKQPGLIKKEPRQGTASTKTNSERTRIDQKTMRMWYIQVQKKSRRSANNLKEVHQEPEV